MAYAPRNKTQDPRGESATQDKGFIRKYDQEPYTYMQNEKANRLVISGCCAAVFFKYAPSFAGFAPITPGIAISLIIAVVGVGISLHNLGVINMLKPPSENEESKPEE